MCNRLRDVRAFPTPKFSVYVCVVCVRESTAGESTYGEAVEIDTKIDWSHLSMVMSCLSFEACCYC